MNGILDITGHRPWPMPDRRWLMFMRWENLLFAHWRVDADVLKKLIPAGLQLDTFKGEAWLGVVPFLMTGTRLRFLPVVPGTHTFPENNVRTYVTCNGKQGVWFFSLDAGSRLAVWSARRFFHLPYFNSQMSIHTEEGEVRYQNRRFHRDAPAARFRASYRPVSEPVQSRPGTLEHWLTERYCLYSVDHLGNIWRGDIHHPPWPLQTAEADIQLNTMAELLGFDLNREPDQLHFARQLEVVAWSIERAAPDQQG